MTVYIEQVLIDNMVVNYFLLWFCSVVLRQEKSKIRFLLASFIGTIFALAFPLFVLPNYISIILKITLGSLLIVIAFKLKSFKQFFTCFLTFVVSTFLFGGIFLGLIISLFSDFEMKSSNLSYSSKVPIGVLLLVAFLVFKVFFDLILYARNKANISNIKFDLIVYYNKNISTIKAFLDTGNLLVDNKTNLPIIVVSFKAFKEILQIETHDFLLGNYMANNSRYQEIKTANKSSKMLLFEVDKIVIDNHDLNKTVTNAVLGLSLTSFSKSIDCEALIGLDLVKTGE